MQTRPQGWFYLAAFAALGTGCATVTTDHDARSARLPTGVTLLASDRDDCAGAIAIDDRVIRSSARADLVVQRGQNATFEIDADDNDDIDIEWTCVGAADTDRSSVECPEETSHVRITRATTGGEFLLECYGDRDGSAARRARR